MGFYEDIAATVSAPMIKQFGASAILRRVTGQTYDRASNEMTGGTVAEWPVKALEVDAKKAAGGGSDPLVPVGDAAFLLPPDIGTVPMDDDKLIFQDETWIILSAKRLSPGGVPLMYTIQVKK